MSVFLSLIVIFSSSNYLVFIAKTPISWLFPYFFQSSLSELRDHLLSLSFVHEIEHNSQLLGCALFFFSVENYKKKDKFLANLSCGPRISSVKLAKMKVLASRRTVFVLYREDPGLPEGFSIWERERDCMDSSMSHPCTSLGQESLDPFLKKSIWLDA